MSACFHGNTLAQGVELIPLLLKTVERAVAQPAQVCFCVLEQYSGTKFSVMLLVIVSLLALRIWT
jgi:hypothetical protein